MSRKTNKVGEEELGGKVKVQHHQHFATDRNTKYKNGSKDFLARKRKEKLAKRWGE